MTKRARRKHRARNRERRKRNEASAREWLAHWDRHAAPLPDGPERWAPRRTEALERCREIVKATNRMKLAFHRAGWVTVPGRDWE